ncbi:putative Late nodulin [Medicago truncatula]|nr:putative Late nodulin [Medicago truncatula]
MEDIVKFVYVIIIFLSIFIIATNMEAKTICIGDSDCRNERCMPGIKPVCSEGWCDCIGFIP